MGVGEVGVLRPPPLDREGEGEGSLKKASLRPLEEAPEAVESPRGWKEWGEEGDTETVTPGRYAEGESGVPGETPLDPG